MNEGKIVGKKLKGEGKEEIDKRKTDQRSTCTLRKRLWLGFFLKKEERAKQKRRIKDHLGENIRK